MDSAIGRKGKGGNKLRRNYKLGFSNGLLINLKSDILIRAKDSFALAS
jgi:hypothetical protein